MTQDEIIKMARQAGFGIGLDDPIIYAAHERFAKLVAQHERERIKQANAPEIERINAHIQKLEDAILAEREACAKIAEYKLDDKGLTAPDSPKEWWNHACKNIRDAIRARTES
jgi:pyruvate formate-lyase activating enzyme-like uncharacterized protein